MFITSVQARSSRNNLMLKTEESLYIAGHTSYYKSPLQICLFSSETTF